MTWAVALHLVIKLEASACEISYPNLRSDDKWEEERQGDIKGKDFYPVGPDVVLLVLFKPRNSQKSTAAG